VASSIVFTDGDVVLAGRLHEPEGGGGPGVVVAGSWLTVKEQMADHYAAELAGRGWTALTFDYAGFGASGGGLRQAELPARKISNLTAAIRFLGTLTATPPAVLGICASAQYAMAAVAAGAPVSGFAAVAGWFHDAASVAGFYGGADGVRARLADAAAAADRFLADGEVTTVPAYRAGDETAGMFVEMDYYANPERGAVPSWRNEMAVLSWPHWLRFDGLSAAAGVRVPALFVHSDGAVFPDHVRDLAGRMGGPVRTVWGEGEQTEWYDRPAQVGAAVEAVDTVLRDAVVAQ
jgi:dienelactone hydrolase